MAASDLWDADCDRREPTHVISYHMNAGAYAATGQGFASAIDRGPLHALADAASSGNGVFRGTATTAFPNQTFNASNYWVDVVFMPNPTGPDTTPPMYRR